jgi:hypothetical protein
LKSPTSFLIAAPVVVGAVVAFAPVASVAVYCSSRGKGL